MIDSRIPWLSVGVSSTDLDSASSLSLLHSIYGSQASQLPFSDYESETSFLGTRSECPQTPASPQRRQRPKSSPAATLAAREHQQLRPGGATSRPTTAGRPTTARRRRPTTAAPRRPSSAVPGRRGGRAGRERPKTALGMHTFSTSSSTVLLDIEEERVAPPTAPVRVTRIPEYFNFWEGKPLLERDYGVQVHQRKAWHRPKSDYGSRFYSQRRHGDQKGGIKGEGQGLETLVEQEGSVSGSGEDDRKALRDQKGGEEEADISKKSDSDGLGTGSRSNGEEKDGNGEQKDGHGSSKSKHVKGRGDRDSQQKNSLKERWAHRKGAWETEDEADNDEYFKQREEEGGLLPTIPSTSNLCSLEDTHGCSVGSQLREKHEDSSTGRHGLLPSLQPPNQLTRSRSTASDKETKVPRNEGCKREQHVKKLDASDPQPRAYNPRKALASVSWLDGGRSSKHTTRFELPMDIRKLEDMSPLLYLRNHTVISERRMAHCSKVFTKLDKDRDSRINRDDLIVGLIEVHHHCITADQARSVLEVVQLPGDQQVDVQLFAAICCLAERMHNLYYLPIARREVIETVDFEALEWKLRGCTISPTLTTLFAQL